MRRVLLLLCSLLGAPAGFTADESPRTPALVAALHQAAARGSVVIVNFRAPACHGCDYMQAQVHRGAAWQSLQRRAVLVELDADTPEGAAQLRAWHIAAPPAYVVLDAEGRERGRLLGEQRREAFHAHVDALLSPRGGREAWQKRAERGDVGAATATLNAYRTRPDPEAGLVWFQALPVELQARLQRFPTIGQALARLQLRTAATAGDVPACQAAAAVALSTDLGCERAQDVALYRGCLGSGAAQDNTLLGQRAPMTSLVERHVFGSAPACADERGVVLGLAELHLLAGDEAAHASLLLRAEQRLRERLAPDLGADRHAADNLRAYLEARGDWEAYDALLPRLVAIWPDDHVYAFRYGRSLLERDRPSEAVAYLERAARRAYGQNRLRVAEQQVRALKRIGAGDEARQLAAEIFAANGPWFPELVATVRMQL